MTRTLHFFWAGGPINASSEDIIKKWAAFLAKVKRETGQDYEIAVWLDPVGSSADAIQATKERLGGVTDVEIKYRAISDLERTSAHPDMYKIMRYEIDKLNANYSAASDVFRYTVLEAEGGMYLDTDINPPSDPAVFASAWQQQGLLITECAAEGSMISNSDLLIAPEPHLPLLHKLLNAISENYTRHFEAPTDETMLFNLMIAYRYNLASKLMMQTYTARDQETIYSQAMKKAGPDMLKEQLLQETEHKGVVLLPGSQAMPPGSLRKPISIEGTAGSWIGRATTAHNHVPEVLTKISQCIDFELTHVGILRTDDHIQSAIEALGYEEPQDSEHIQALIEQIIVLIDNKLQSEEQRSLVQCCQLTFKFPQTQTLYTRHRLLAQTGLTPFTPDLGLVENFNKMHQPFATQHRIPPHDQKDRSKHLDLTPVYTDLAQSTLAFRTELLRFYQLQYHDNLDGLIHFSAEDITQYITILESIQVENAPQAIQNLHSQLLDEARMVQSHSQNVSITQAMRLSMKEAKWSRANDNDMNQRLTEKITKLERATTRTTKQNMKLQLLQMVRDAQGENVVSLRQKIMDNKAFIISKTGIETFVLSNAILGSKLNVQIQDTARDDDGMSFR